MANSAANVRVGVTGSASHAPLTTKLPTDAAAILDPAFADVGYISEDGVTEAISTDVSDVKAWQDGDVVRKVQTSHDVTYKFTMLESTTENLGLYYADPHATAALVRVTGAQPEHKVWVLELIDGSDTIRVVLPDAQITERGEVTWANGDAVMYEVTITAYPDSTKTKAYIYRSKGTAPSSAALADAA